MKILVANPAKNITVFVIEPVENPAERAALARAILAEKSLGAEQVGFIIPPVSASQAVLWRLEMAGGEFCGNATRSFGLYVARTQGLKGKTKVSVSVSGADGPVQVEVDTEKGQASAEMPKPLSITSLDYEGHPLSVLIFEGITHAIAPDLKSGNDTFFAIKSLVEEKLFSLREGLPPAFGVMFYDTSSRFMRPAVYVKSTESLVFESSCGSGSAALGVWLGRDLFDGSAQYALSQPGGVIETEVVKKAGKINRLTIGGEVKLGEPQEFNP